MIEIEIGRGDAGDAICGSSAAGCRGRQEVESPTPVGRIDQHDEDPGSRVILTTVPVAENHAPLSVVKATDDGGAIGVAEIIAAGAEALARDVTGGPLPDHEACSIALAELRRIGNVEGI